MHQAHLQQAQSEAQGARHLHGRRQDGLAEVGAVERDGQLWKTDIEEEDSVSIGSDFDTRALWAWQGKIYLLENSGNLYKIDPETGDFAQHGDDGVYSDTVTAAVHQGVLYAVEDDGALGATDLDDGGYTEHDDEDFSEVRHLFSAGGNLYAIENDGTLYKIDLD